MGYFGVEGGLFCFLLLYEMVDLTDLSFDGLLLDNGSTCRPKFTKSANRKSYLANQFDWCSRRAALMIGSARSRVLVPFDFGTRRRDSRILALSLYFSRRLSRDPCACDSFFTTDATAL